jgi:hypothetical protein
LYYWLVENGRSIFVCGNFFDEFVGVGGSLRKQMGTFGLQGLRQVRPVRRKNQSIRRIEGV